MRSSRANAKTHDSRADPDCPLVFPPVVLCQVSRVDPVPPFRVPPRALTERLRAEECDWLLHLLRQWCPGYKTESDLQFWQEGFHPQALMSDEVMEQKLVYLHRGLPRTRGGKDGGF